MAGSAATPAAGRHLAAVRWVSASGDVLSGSAAAAAADVAAGAEAPPDRPRIRLLLVLASLLLRRGKTVMKLFLVHWLVT